MLIRSLSAALFSLSLAACTHPLTPVETPPPSGTLYDYQIQSPNGVPYSLNELANALGDYDVVLVGEWHTHPGIHLFEAQLLSTLAARYPATALSLEQFSRAEQATLDAYLAGETGENTFIDKSNAWPNYVSDYRPLIEIARQDALPVIAANAPQSIVRCIGREGESYLERLSGEERGWVADTLTKDESPYKEKFFAAMFHGDETKTLNQYLAQIAWDDTMAESIVDFLAANPGYKVMQIAGAFHVEEGLGIASRITARNPALKVAIISPQTADDPLAAEITDFRLVVNALPSQWVNEEEMNQAIAAMRHSSATTCP